jgi:hypothetical protein
MALSRYNAKMVHVVVNKTQNTKKPATNF